MRMFWHQEKFKGARRVHSGLKRLLDIHTYSRNVKYSLFAFLFA